MLDRTSAPTAEPRRQAAPGTRRETQAAANSADAGLETWRNVRRAGVIMLVAMVLMAMFNSDDLRSLARDVPANPLAEATVSLADGWHELMRALGPAHLRPAVRAAFERVRSLSW